MHKRLFTAVREAYARFGEDSNLAASRPLLLYSFGPNRRRDTPLERLEGTDAGPIAMEGDDIGVLVDIAPGQTGAGPATRDPTP